MIPQELVIEGIYSYRRREVIDFRPLLDAHLFGIFGAVGSGKSSLLEAITYALYGQVQRMNRKEGLAANLMNLEADQAYISFQFQSSVDQHTYRCVVHGKRRKAGPELSRSFYRADGQHWQEVEEAIIHRAVGLNYKHFCRTIIVPQGKFQEFLLLSDSERTSMMQELFHLHRFDLKNAVARLTAEVDRKEHYLRGQIHHLEEEQSTPEEDLIQAEKAARERVQQTRLQLSKIATRHADLTAWRQVWEKTQVLEKAFQKAADQLTSRRTAWEQAEAEHAVWEKAFQSISQWREMRKHLGMQRRKQEFERERKDLLQQINLLDESLKPRQTQLDQHRSSWQQHQEMIQAKVTEMPAVKTIEQFQVWHHSWLALQEQGERITAEGKALRKEVETWSEEIHEEWARAQKTLSFEGSDRKVPDWPGITEKSPGPGCHDGGPARSSTK